VGEHGGQHVFVLTFHGIGHPRRAHEHGEEQVWLPSATFEAILDAVTGRQDVRITFDDGNASDVDLALPALEARGLQAEFFLAAGRIGTPGYLTREQVQALVQAGMRVGSHGMDHRPWPRLSDDELHRELIGAQQALEAMAATPVRRVACPFGAYDRRVLRKLREGGFERVYTSDGGPTRPDAWLQSRTSLTRTHGVDHITRLLAAGPRGPDELFRRLKMLLKRWR
jgi:peptidoglycan/xylan/chitin deacetylase (PgdA/CDA1 family)